MQYTQVQCGTCESFQVIQDPKSRKFACKMCRERNSVRRVYGRSEKAKEMRLVCQRLSRKRFEIAEEKEQASREARVREETLASASYRRDHEDEDYEHFDGDYYESGPSNGHSVYPGSSSRERPWSQMPSSRVHEVSCSRPTSDLHEYVGDDAQTAAENDDENDDENDGVGNASGSIWDQFLDPSSSNNYDLGDGDDNDEIVLSNGKRARVVTSLPEKTSTKRRNSRSKSSS